MKRILLPIAVLAVLMAAIWHSPGIAQSVSVSGGAAPFSFTSAAGLTASFNTSLSAEKGPRWAQNVLPSVSAVASSSKAAGAAGVRHVADCLYFSASATTAPTATNSIVVLRDGAAGAGTIVWANYAVFPASIGQLVAPTTICGLNIVGTAATAMTVEFNTSQTNVFEQVGMTGYDVQ